MADQTKTPKLSPAAIKELRRSRSLRSDKYSIGGRLKTRDLSKAPITLRLPPGKR